MDRAAADPLLLPPNRRAKSRLRGRSESMSPAWPLCAALAVLAEMSDSAGTNAAALDARAHRGIDGSSLG